MSNIRIGIDLGEVEVEPRAFVESTIIAEELGFDSVWFGDHFMPWIHTGGKSAFVWSLMASALERTSRVVIGPDVTSPIGGRFHPAIVAQAAATLDNLYPGRFVLGVGSGEAVNEARFFQERENYWPEWDERIERLCEAIKMIRRLWKEKEYFSFEGKYFKMNNLLLYTKPGGEIPVYFSALGPKAACLAGKFGDHLLTMASVERCRDLIFPQFENGMRMEHKDTYKS